MLRKLGKDEGGATMIEMTLVIVMLLVLTFGLVEFGLLFLQWNEAEKATQIGARSAIVDDPVAEELATFDCQSGSLVPGTPCSDPAALSFGEPICNGASQSCTEGFTFDSAAFNRIVTAMQTVFPNIRPEDVFIQYTDVGLGYAGRRSPVGMVTVGLSGMTFNFVALDSLLGLGPVSLPDFRTTLSTEDMNSAGVS